VAVPFQRWKLDPLLGPDRRYVRMGEISQSQVGPNCFRYIDDYVARLKSKSE
jgi:hypothetical protein